MSLNFQISKRVEDRIKAKRSASNSHAADSGFGVDKEKTIASSSATWKNYHEVVRDDSPVGFWQLNETSGTTASDASGFGRDGEYSGGPTLGESSGIFLPTANTQSSSTGHSILIDGSDSNFPRVKWANPTWFPFSESFTIEAWVKTSKSGTKALWSYGASEFLVLISDTSTDVDGVAISHASVADGNWHHFVVVNDSGSTTIYVDAQAGGTETTGTVADQGSSAFLVVGQDQDSNDGGYATAEAWDGHLDELAIYSGTLSEERIQEHFNSGTGVNA